MTMTMRNEKPETRDQRRWVQDRTFSKETKRHTRGKEEEMGDTSLSETMTSLKYMQTCTTALRGTKGR